ncbi:MAG: bifunctional diaminohydroxyphosphoribosylaminopyrimidine deaminase/5-amino-6-(5-phosphoribosylamino)uracil reductase RibD [Hasllibacter sp.]
MSATAAEDRRWMDAALALGRRGLGQTAPNPAVGCVIVRGGRVVGRGRTAPGGRPHAERAALDMAGEGARGATAYVTLEPCAHHGATPPCADALIGAGIARCVVALRDPDPRVDGGGIARLRAAGIAVTEGVGADRAAEDQAGFLLRVAEGRPFVTLKLAASLDGRIATATGESRWITSPAARRLVHAERARHDAVMVGAGTVRADDPDLTVRGWTVPRQPARVVLSRRLDLPLGALAATAREAPVLLIHGPGAPEDARAAWTGVGATLVPLRTARGRPLDPGAALGALAGRGITRVLCEGGGTLAAALLQAGLVDELLTFHAGLALGAEGRPMLGALGLGALADAPRLRLHDLRPVGADALARWRPVPGRGD